MFRQHTTFITMLQPGTSAPTLTLQDQHGKPFDLSSSWSLHHVVLFFYPKAFTPVCTKEVCGFRDAYAELSAQDARVIGISRDPSERQHSFAAKFQLPYTLLSDVDEAAHRAFDVKGLFGLLSGRVTYVIARGGIIRAAYSARFEAQGHIQLALDELADQGKG